MTEERITGGYAALKTDSTDVPVQVSGIALGEGDITRGGSGKKTLWPRETLEEAAEGLEGQPLATDQNHTTDGTQPQTPSKAVIGEITWSGYKPGVGVLYEAELDDPDIARSVKNGRLEVSPLVSREVEPLENHPEAEFKATKITRWRDLATVVNGAAPSNQITVGDNPMKAEALHEVVEALQEDIALTPPQEVQDHAQEVLDWREDGDKDVQGMTDTGWNRAEQLASGDELSASDVQEIAAWFARHGSEEYDLNEDSMDPWEDNGRVAIKGWGGPPMRSWIMDKREQLVDAGELEAMHEALQLSGARTPTYDGTETGDWSEVSKDLSDVTDAVGIDAESVADLTDDQKQAIAEHTLLGDPNGESWREVFFFPVVNPSTGDLNENALDAVRGGRGQQADIPQDAYDSAESIARSLLEDEFDREFESMAAFDELSDDDLVEWESSGGTAQGRIVDLRDEGDPDYDDEIDGDVTVSPPAALIEIVGMDDGEIVGRDTMVAHKPDTLTKIDESDVESMAEHQESMQDVPEEYIFDNPGEAMTKAGEMGLSEIHTHGDGSDTVFMPGETHAVLMDAIQSDDGTQESMSQSSVAEETTNTTTMSETDLTDDEQAVLEAAADIEAPVEALNEYAATEQPTIVEQTDYESLSERVDTLKTMMQERIVDETGLREETVESMGFDALAKEFETEDGDFDAEALVQKPEAGDVDGDDTEALSEDADVELAEGLMGDYESMAHPPQGLEDDIVEALGVSDFDEAQEVLN